MAGSGSCYSTIAAAVAVSGTNDVIRVAKGTHHESVVVTRRLSLLSERADNTLTGNALPGVGMHSHAPGQVLDDDVITGNPISGNGTDGDLGPSLPTMGISISSAVVPVTGIVIAENEFKGEGMDIAVNVSNAASALSVHFNSFFGEVGVGNLGAGSISATSNWWKCSKGPGASGCSTASGSNITADPWFTSPF